MAITTPNSTEVSRSAARRGMAPSRSAQSAIP
jgi:hypothetical protein